jgi:hypothetical protein
MVKGEAGTVYRNNPSPKKRLSVAQASCQIVDEA